MKLQNNVFFNEHFVSAFKKLLKFDLDSTITIRLIKSVKILDDQQYAVLLTRDHLVDQFASKNNSGQIISEDGMVYFETPEKKQEFEKKFNNLLRDDFEIPVKEKIKLTKAHKISGESLSALLDIVEVVDDDEDGGK